MQCNILVRIIATLPCPDLSRQSSKHVAEWLLLFGVFIDEERLLTTCCFLIFIIPNLLVSPSLHRLIMNGLFGLNI